MLSSHDRTRLAAEAIMCERTVRRIYGGKGGTEYSRLRVAAAARKLGLPEPPEPPEPSTLSSTSSQNALPSASKRG